MIYARVVSPQETSTTWRLMRFSFSAATSAGMHGGGAARAARLYFGAVMGQGVRIAGAELYPHDAG